MTADKALLIKNQNLSSKTSDLNYCDTPIVTTVCYTVGELGGNCAFSNNGRCLSRR